MIPCQMSDICILQLLLEGQEGEKNGAISTAYLLHFPAVRQNDMISICGVNLMARPQTPEHFVYTSKRMNK